MSTLTDARMPSLADKHEAQEAEMKVVVEEVKPKKVAKKKKKDE